MTTYAKRLPIFAFALMMLVLFVMGSQPQTARQVVLAQQATQQAAPTQQATGGNAQPAATQQAASGLPANKPTIRGSLNGAAIDGVPGSFCWPSSSGAQCDFIDDPQPKTPISVAEGDSLIFTVDPAQPAPEQFLATILDDQGIPADKKEQQLTDATFVVTGLGKGQRRVQIDAQYPGDAAFQPFVSYVFLLDVSDKATAVALVTPQATEAPTAEATPAPTEVATEAPTVEPTAAPTQAATPVATQAPTAQATKAPTAAPTAVATAVPTAPPTAVATSVATTAATTAATAVSTTAPTAAATTPAPVQTVVVTPAAGTGGSAASVNAVIPIYAGTLTVNARAFDATAVNACVITSAQETICVDRATNAIRAFAVPSSAAQFVFKGPRPTAITLTISTGDGKQISKQAFRADNLILFNLPSGVGNYIITIELAYPQGRATYSYQMAIVG